MPSSCAGERRLYAASARTTQRYQAGILLFRPDDRPYFQQLRKERQLQRLLQERNAGRTAGAALVADDALDRLHVAEAPELEALLDVDELLAHVVVAPELLGLLVDATENRYQLRTVLVRLGPVALDAALRNGVTDTRKITQEFVVQARRLENLAQDLLCGRVIAEHLGHVGVLVAEQELDQPVLKRLEAGCRSEHVAEFHVLARRQRLEHSPLLEQLALDLLHAREDLQAWTEFAAAQMRD